MTKKDYQLIADVLLNTNASEETIKEMAKELKLASGYTLNGNKSFKTDVFIKACKETCLTCDNIGFVGKDEKCLNCN